MAREPKSEALRVRVTPSMRDHVEREADRLECDVSDVIRLALTGYLSTCPSKPKRTAKR